jgi:hypothetical protein
VKLVAVVTPAFRISTLDSVVLERSMTPVAVFRVSLPAPPSTEPPDKRSAVSRVKVESADTPAAMISTLDSVVLARLSDVPVA